MPIHSKAQLHGASSSEGWSPTSAAQVFTLTLLVLVCLFVFMALSEQAAESQTYKVIYDLNEFYGSGLFPFAGVTFDSSGNMYVTTKEGGQYGDYGTVFMLSPSASGWAYSPIYDFRGGDDGAWPYDRVVFGPEGDLYGATAAGGGGAAYCHSLGGCGTVFKLHKRGNAWQETQLYAFQRPSDGMWPYNGDLIFDRSGNIYGTTEQGGYSGGNCQARDGCGIVYKLAPSGGGYVESTLYRFVDAGDGGFPNAGVILDAAGNLYGTAGFTVYELSPSQDGWTEKTLYTFAGGLNGNWPFGGVIFDGAGNLYGTTFLNGAGDAGTVFELASSGGSWSYRLLYGLVTLNVAGLNYRGPEDSLTMDNTGNLYGTTSGGGRYGFGAVFKLTRTNRGWTYTGLHDFCAGGLPCPDGAYPAASVSFDAHGNLFGTTEYGGGNWGGVVWEITP